MPDPRDHPAFLDEVEAALEASCAALMMLQRLDAELAAGSEGEDIHGHIVHALDALRIVAEELRCARSTGENGLALGFVLASSRRPRAASN